MIKYATLEKNVQEIADKIGKDSEYKEFVKHSQFYIIINSRLTTGALARTNWIYKPDSHHIHQGNIEFNYERPGGAKRSFKINSHTDWIYKIEFSEMALRHASWTDIKEIISHELSHDYDFYKYNGKSHNHGPVFVEILTRFKKLVGVRYKGTHGFATDKANQKWGKEVREKREAQYKKKLIKEANRQNQAALLTYIYEKWYPMAERADNVIFDSYWEYVKDFIKNHQSEVVKIVPESIVISRDGANYWYFNGSSVYRNSSGTYQFKGYASNRKK